MSHTQSQTIRYGDELSQLEELTGTVSYDTKKKHNIICFVLFVIDSKISRTEIIVLRSIVSNA